MSEHPFARARPTLNTPLSSSSSGLSTASAPSSSRPATGSPSPFGAIKSISRKKPLGLDISKSIPKPSRSVSTIVTGPDSAAKDGASVSWIPEADRLRDEIARLQLSSRSSSSSYNSGPESPPSLSPLAPSAQPALTATPPRPPRRQHTAPELPTASTPSSSLHASSSTSSRKKHHSNGKRSKRDKEDDGMVKEEDLTVLADLGSGNGGTVTKVWNKKRNCVMAKKVSCAPPSRALVGGAWISY